MLKKEKSEKKEKKINIKTNGIVQEIKQFEINFKIAKLSQIPFQRPFEVFPFEEELRSFPVNDAFVEGLGLARNKIERRHKKMMIMLRGFLLNFDLYIHLNINSYSSIRMKTEFYSVLILFVLVTPIQNAAFVLTNWNKHGGQMEISTCNKDTLIDFGFTSNTQITCNVGGCSTTNPQQSAVRFLDVGGREELYYLQNTDTSIYKSTDTTSRTQQQGLIKLKFMSGTGRVLYVGIPFSNSISSKLPSDPKIYELNMNKIGDSAFNSIKSVTEFNAFSLSALNYLNMRDYGHFYSLANSATAPFETYLLSYFILSNVKFDTTKLPTAPYNFPRNLFATTETYLATGDRLCWGAASEGIFQTHLRESYPLWAAWIGILLYWLYILLAESNDNNCYDKKFENNKWTCWGFYSLHFLGHEDYFTKLSRTTLMLITFSWEGCVLAILYHNIQAGQGPVMILWAALIAVGTAMPFTYVLGAIFMRKIYQLTLFKYDTLKQMKGVFNKKDSKMQALQKSIDDTEESLYGYYYWYYVLAFTLFGSFWIIAVQQMMQNHRDYYYLMHHWLASLGVALGFEHLFFDPLLTLILGNTSFYRVRGFFYDFRLGERFKEIEQ